MGNLGDALKKAGLINEADQRRAERARSHGSRGQRPGSGNREAARAGAGRRTESGDPLEARAIDMRGADQRWHYEDANGRLPFVLVTREARSRLERGEYALVASGRTALVVPAAALIGVPDDVAKRIIHPRRR